MRIFNRVVAWIYGLASLFVSVGFILMWIDAEIRERYIASFAALDPWKLGLVGVFLLLLGAVWLVSSIEHYYRTRSVSFGGPGGQVRVHLSAVEHLLMSEVLREVRAVKKIKTVAVSSPKGLRVYNQVVIWSQYEIPPTVARIQDLVRRLLQDSIGVERVGDVRVTVYHISESGQSEAAEEEKEGAEPVESEIH